jgi:hypothetical protein
MIECYSLPVSEIADHQTEGMGFGWRIDRSLDVRRGNVSFAA